MFRPRCLLKRSANNNRRLKKRVSAVDSTPQDAAGASRTWHVPTGPSRMLCTVDGMSKRRSIACFCRKVITKTGIAGIQQRRSNRFRPMTSNVVAFRRHQFHHFEMRPHSHTSKSPLNMTLASDSTRINNACSIRVQRTFAVGTTRNVFTGQSCSLGTMECCRC
jgi:hypothetical protein